MSWALEGTAVFIAAAKVKWLTADADELTASLQEKEGTDWYFSKGSTLNFSAEIQTPSSTIQNQWCYQSKDFKIIQQFSLEWELYFAAV